MSPISMPQGSRIESQAQLDAARATRRELNTQLEAVTERRGDLVQERHNAQATGNQTVVAEYDAQIAELGARLKRLETQKAQMDDAIMDATRRGVGQAAQETPPPGGPWAIAPTPPTPPVPSNEIFTLLPPRDLSWFQINAERLLVGQGLLFVLLGVVLWRVARRGGRSAPELQGGVDQMRQAVDAIAVEVERISENQRYVTKLIADRLGENAAKGIETSAKERVDSR